MIWRFIRHRINNLDKRFQEAQQELIRSLYGREDTPPRWKFCVSYANGNLGQSVGSLFVKKYFDEQSKADVSLNKAVYFSEMEIIQYFFMDVARSQHTLIFDREQSFARGLRDSFSSSSSALLENLLHF